MPQKEWFATWFDSPYYHLLYQHRDDNEAQQFLDHLIAKLALASNAHVLDLACGKGRHSITLAQKGFMVVGADLAANSIAAAELNQRCCHQEESDSIHCALFIAFVHSCIIKDFARNDVVSGLVSPQI
jgi:cyclopropane fatty-acyl-phospholipid synthase-like methyltransferase